MYNYREAVKSDIRDYIYSNAELDREDFLFNRSRVQDELYDQMFVADEVTGNASGSYTFSTWEAEENLCHNLDLLGEACAEFGDSVSRILESAESADVTIRCYLLGQCLDEVLDEIEEELEDEDED